MFDATARAICESGAALFGVTVDNRGAHGERGPGPGALDRAWTFLLGRFELFVREQGPGRAGHVVSDRTGREDMRRIRALVSASVRRRNPMSGVRTSRVTEVEFVDSLASPLVQAAGIIAYIISRHINGDERFGEMASRLLEMMWPAAACGAAGRRLGCRCGATILHQQGCRRP